MKKVITALMYVCMVYSYLYADHASLVPYRDGNKCGYADRNMKIIVKPQFDACGDMIDGMASVMKNGKSGFIDNSGREAVALQFSYSKNFKNGGAIVKKGDKYGVINRKGEAVIPFTDYEISDYSDGAAVVSKDYIYGLMDRTGRMILPLKFSKFDVAGNSLYIVAEKIPNSFYAGKNFLYNIKGEPVVTDGFDLIYPAANGFLKIKSGNKWGYINESGAVITPAIYDNIRNIKKDGTAAFMLKDKWGILSGEGKVVVRPEYDEIGSGDGTYDEEMQADKDYFIVRLNGKYGILSLKGDVMVKPDYAMIASGKSGFFPAYREIGKSGNLPVNGLTLLDNKGWELFKPKKEYNSTGEEGEGLFPAGTMNNFSGAKVMGYLNHQGEVVISLQYEKAYQFSGGYAVVMKNGLYGVIDKTGKEVEQFIYEDIFRSENYPGLFEGTVAGKKVYFEPGGRHFWK